MKKKKCPECNSEDIRFIKKKKRTFLVCNHCFYDETEESESYPEQRTSQKAKGSYSPYKTGGSRRTNK